MDKRKHKKTVIIPDSKFRINSVVCNVNTAAQQFKDNKSILDILVR